MAEKTPDPRRRRYQPSMPSKPSSSAAYTVGMETATPFDVLRRKSGGPLLHILRVSKTRYIFIEDVIRASSKVVRLRRGTELKLGEEPPAPAREAAAAAVVLEPEKEVERLVWEYVKRMKEHNPSWKPETSKLSDGERTFGDYWRAEPRDYEPLARIVQRVLSTAR